MAKYRILAGKHSAKYDTGNKDANGKAIFERVTHSPKNNPVIETATDLLKFNMAGSRPKFELVGAAKEQPPAPATPPAPAKDSKAAEESKKEPWPPPKKS